MSRAEAGARPAKRRGFVDTLALRLALLMWAALVGSHLLAFLAVQALRDDAGAPGAELPPLPTLPSLPPTPGLLPDPGPRPEHGPGPPPPGHEAHPPGPPPSLHEAPRWPPGGVVPGGDGAVPPRAPPGAPGTPPEMRPPPGLSGRLLVIDYSVRLLVIGLAAWFGSRWLAAPMRRLAAASRELAGTVASEPAAAPLDEGRGTVEVREMAQVFNQMAAELRQQFRSRALMVAAISHDLRTPLTRLRMRLESGGLDTERRDRSVADIREMDRLIDDALLVFRSAGTGGAATALQAVDLAALLQSCIDDRAEQGEAIEALTITGPAVLRTDLDALRRVLDNLFGNALRYGQRARVSLAGAADRWLVSVEDDGPGIPPDQLERVFEPFYRLEGSRGRDTGGSGLGLYIARDLSRRLGGRLWLENRPQGGLSARLELPAG